MKYIKENNSSRYDQSDIKKALSRSIKSGDIKMSISFDEFVNKSLNLQKPEIGSFESLVQDMFISMGDEIRMGDYIKRFNQLDIDTSKLDALFPKYQEYLNFDWDGPREEDFIDGSYEDDEDEKYKKDLKEYEEIYNNWWEKSDEHQDIREEFNIEVKRLCEIAKEKLGI